MAFSTLLKRKRNPTLQEHETKIKNIIDKIDTIKIKMKLSPAQVKAVL